MNRPPGNVTGTSIFATGLEGKRFNLLHEVVPRSATIAVLLNRNSIAAEAQSTDIQSAAHALQRQVYRGPVLRHPAGLIQAANFRSATAS